MVDPLENWAASFSAKVFSLLPEQLKFLAFASPVSARSPDIFLLWHPQYRNHRRLKILGEHLFYAIVKKIRGYAWLFSKRKQFHYKIYGFVKDALLISPALCGKEVSGRWQTNYVRVSELDALFVFGFGNEWGTQTQQPKPLSLLEALRIAWKLMIGGFQATLIGEESIFNKILVLLLWLSWVFSYEWMEPYYLQETLKEFIAKHKISKIGCIHEAHGYTRVIWPLAQKVGLRSYSLQHASITYGKRWYFPLVQEIQGGIILPQVMTVYEPGMKKLLDSVFPGTHFQLGCSWRYAHWKDALPLNFPGQYFLFVGALAGFDNTVLVQTLKNLRSAGGIGSVRLRLHPLARLTQGQWVWLREQEKAGWLEFSNQRPLREDLTQAKVVIGMSTTVLEEALLLGRPVVHLQDKEYLPYIDLEGVNGAWAVSWKKLDKQFLEQIPSQVDVSNIRHRFGLDFPVVDYTRFFQEQNA